MKFGGSPYLVCYHTDQGEHRDGATYKNRNPLQRRARTTGFNAAIGAITRAPNVPTRSSPFDHDQSESDQDTGERGRQ